MQPRAMLNAALRSSGFAKYFEVSVAAARASGAYLITVPSQPGKRLDGDYVTTTLADPTLTDWARNITRQTR